MLLETLDIRNNDVVIYSQNKEQQRDNYRIIFKQSTSRSPHKISYEEVSEFVNEPSPKNLILYRLLTNVKNMDPKSSRYGNFINIDGVMELFYFDPILAINDLKYLHFNLDKYSFRFKIQQVGLTSKPGNIKSAIYTEVFKSDMKAIEAQNQNDKIFADAIFVFDETYEMKTNFPTFGATISPKDDPNKHTIFSIEETTDTKSEVIKKTDSVEIKDLVEKSKNEPIKEKKTKTETRAFSKFIQKHKIKLEENKFEKDKTESTSDEIFKQSKIKDRESVVLKFNP